MRILAAFCLWLAGLPCLAAPVRVASVPTGQVSRPVLIPAAGIQLSPSPQTSLTSLTVPVSVGLSAGPSLELPTLPGPIPAAIEPVAAPIVPGVPFGLPGVPSMDASPSVPGAGEQPAGVESESAKAGAVFDGGVLQAAPSKMVGTVARSGREVLVDGRTAPLLGFGSFKEAFVHPADSEAVVKLFSTKFVVSRGESLSEKRLEVSAIRKLEPLAVVPKLLEQGAVSLDGQPVGYIVQERVRGRTLEKVSRDQLAHVKKLFDILAGNGVLMADFENPVKWRANIMVGTTRAGGLKAYLVDADMLSSHGKSSSELGALYGRLYRSLEASLSSRPVPASSRKS
ncbi:MAG: hypothetical protein HZB91_04140 [Elusimicrobia bacterium]|nr:hypothetical protein [Elusimicrobiota bacterium]